MDLPRTLRRSPGTGLSDQTIGHAMALLELPVWVGSPSAQEAVDDAVALVVESLTGPLRERRF